ncbi:MAG: thiamine pyrophosphate-dependent enzyme, partial [Clostridium baratii]|nr:thiamine pyrophosphate-dependent enzyme [Clostridium baratii]
PEAAEALFEKTQRDAMERLVDLANEAIVSLEEGEAKEALKAWVENVELGEGTRDRADRVVAALEGLDNEFAKEILKEKDFLLKPSQWIFGGDGWSYDIGFGGVDHVLASGEDVNIFVFDTEVYSNTGGQSSKATPTAAIAKFAASGKKTKKKDLGMIAMTYGYVYVAQISMGADKNQTLKAIAEAEAYKGPSLIIAYAPCISHGLKAGMGNSQLEEKRAVECGYWAMYRFNPMLKETGKNPFSLDSKEPTGDFREFIMGEVRYAALAKAFPEAAEALFEKTERDAKERLENYKKLAAN